MIKFYRGSNTNEDVFSKHLIKYTNFKQSVEFNLYSSLKWDASKDSNKMRRVII